MVSYYSSKELSWKKTTELLLEIARTAEETGYYFPCLLVAAKEDLGTYPTSVQDAARVSKFYSVNLINSELLQQWFNFSRKK